MGSTKNIFEKIVLGLTCAMVCFLMLGSIKYISAYAGLTVNVTGDKYFLTLFAAVLLFLSMVCFWNYINKHEKQIKKINICLWSLMIIFEVVFLLCFHCLPTSDSQEVVNAAIEIAKGNHNYMAGAEYFAMYSNNSLLAIMTSWIYKPFYLFFQEKTNFILINNIITILCLNGAVVFSYLIVKKIRDEKSACKLLFLCTIHPIQYLCIAWYYSVTMSALFSMAILYLAILIKEETIKKKRWIKVSLIGILTGVGLLLRPTVAIATIAVVLGAFLYSKKKKRLILECVFGVILCLVCIAGLKCWIHSYVSDSSHNFPITHWISMGLEKNGTNEDYGANYPKDVKLSKEMISYDLKRIKKNMSEYQIISFSKHIIEKMFINWCDGSSALCVKVGSDTKFSKVYYYVVSGKADFLLIYCQAFRYVCYLLIALAIINKRKQQKEETFILFLNLFGAILFYLIWEVKSDYNIPFLYLCLCLGMDGIEWIEKRLENRDDMGKKIVAGSLIMIIAATFVLAEKEVQYGTKKKYNIKEYAIAMNSTKHLKGFESLAVENQALLQEFVVDKSLNYIKLYCSKIGTEGSYQIDLLDSSYQCIQKWKVSQSDIQKGQEKNTIQYEEGANKGYLILEFPNMTIKKETKFFIRIVAVNHTDSIKWFYHDYNNFDYYKGDLWIGNKHIIGELALKVGYQENKTYMSVYEYRVIEVILLGYELLLLGSCLYRKRIKE